MIIVSSSYTDFANNIPKHGNWFDFGNFTKCLEFKQKVGDENIQGKHCLIQYQSIQNDTIQMPPGKNLPF
jgi:Nose resistant-to-fluoxetine protein, N-terminal domain